MNVKKLIIMAVNTSLLTLLASAPVLAKDNWDNKVSILFGQKKLDKDDFSDSTHPAFGINVDIKHKSWPVSIAIDLMSAGEEKKVDGEKIEKVTGGLHLGIRKHWLVGNQIEPYIGGGINLSVFEQKKKYNDTVETQDDDDIGYWLATGVNWKFDNNMMVGAQIRYTEAEASLADTTIDTGGFYTLFSIGYQF